MPEKTSIHDVARMANVSISTVSRVLNGRNRVAQSTRKAVENAARRLRYEPNIRGRALSMQKTETLGLVLPDFLGDYFGRLMQGVDEEARQSGFHLIVTRAQGSHEKREAVERLIAGGRIDGLIIMLDQHNNSVFDLLCGIAAPLVVLDEDVEHRHLDNVLVDNRTGARDETEHLIAVHGIRDLFFLGGPAENIDTRDRADGFRDALAAAGIAAMPERIVTTTYDFEAGFQVAVPLASKLRAAGRWGIVAANDDLARGVIEGLRTEGLRVPEDGAVVGYDDSRLAALTKPALTSVRVPLREVGHAAVRLLLAAMKDPEARPSKVVLKSELIVRQSCGCGM